MNDDFSDVISRLWNLTGPNGGPDDGLPAKIETTGPRTVLPAAFDVTGLATGAVAVATLAAAQLSAARRGTDVPPVTVDTTAACAAFAAERLFTPLGWELPPLWDPIAGNYRAGDAWIRLHTNYPQHRAAAERVLGARDRQTAQAAVARWSAAELETALVEAGGAAAVMHDRERWLASPAGAASVDAAPVSVAERDSPAPAGPEIPAAIQPFAGVRVLDLTRVIAGPVATRFLAGYGADVLRIDPPGFEEVASLLPETTLGKRTAFLDLTAAADRATFADLLAHADVLVCGLRADALARLGYDDQAITALNPGLIHASLDAYGWAGPWRNRRGFDSLVQMSCGIAARGAVAAGRDEPTPLPVQALDHGTGWLLAAAIARSLTRRLARSTSARIHACLIGTANLLYPLSLPDDQPPAPEADAFTLEFADTAWGAARRAPLPGCIDGIPPRWAQQPGPLGRHTPAWKPR